MSLANKILRECSEIREIGFAEMAKFRAKRKASGDISEFSHHFSRALAYINSSDAIALAAAKNRHQPVSILSEQVYLACQGVHRSAISHLLTTQQKGLTAKEASSSINLAIINAVSAAAVEKVVNYHLAKRDSSLRAVSLKS